MAGIAIIEHYFLELLKKIVLLFAEFAVATVCYIGLSIVA